jgi:hypothetical protein
MWAEINAGRIPKLTVAVCTCIITCISLISHIHSPNSNAGTWNVNGKILKHQDVSDWLCPPGCKKADIIAVGLQEMVSLNTFNVAVSDGAAGKAAQKWVQVLETRLGSTEYVDFVILLTHSLTDIAKKCLKNAHWVNPTQK